MKKPISNIEWGLVIGAALTIDVIQALLDVFFIGIILNRFISLAAGFFLPFYFKLRGVKMDQKHFIMLALGILIKQIPGLDMLPVWTGYVVRTMILYKAEQKLKTSV